MLLVKVQYGNGIVQTGSVPDSCALLPGRGPKGFFKFHPWQVGHRFEVCLKSSSSTVGMGTVPTGTVSVHGNLRGVNLKLRRAYVSLFLIMRAHVAHKNVIV